MGILFFAVIPIIVWVINMFAACHIIEKNCSRTVDNPPPSVGQAIIKYLILTAIIFAIYSTPLLLLSPLLKDPIFFIASIQHLGPTTPIWICVSLAAVFFIWEIYRHKSMEFAHLGSAVDQIGLFMLVASVVVWTGALLFAISYIFTKIIWYNPFYS